MPVQEDIISKSSGRRTRRVFNPEFKAKVALAALREAKTLVELFQQFELDPTQITEWKKQLLSSAAGVFAASSKGQEPVDLVPLHKVCPYLLRKLAIKRSNQLRALDTTYIRMARGFVKLTAVVDVNSRRILAHPEWRSRWMLCTRSRRCKRLMPGSADRTLSTLTKAASSLPSSSSTR